MSIIIDGMEMPKELGVGCTIYCDGKVTSSHDYNTILGRAKEYLPSGNRGTWLEKKGVLHPLETSAVCSCCDFATMLFAKDFFNYCPNCGAKMRVN